MFPTFRSDSFLEKFYSDFGLDAKDVQLGGYCVAPVDLGSDFAHGSS